MYFVNESAFGWATFVLFSKDMGFLVIFRYRLHTSSHSVGSGRWFQNVDFCSKHDYGYIFQVCFMQLGRFKDNI